MVCFRCLVACGQSVVLGRRCKGTERENLVFSCHGADIFWCWFKCQIGRKSFHKYQPEMHGRDLGPRTRIWASEDAQWTRLSAKCTGKKEGTFYIAQSMHVTQLLNTMNTLHDGLMSSLTAQFATSLDSLLPFNCKCTLYWCQRLCKRSEKNVVEFAKRVEQSPALCSKS